MKVFPRGEKTLRELGVTIVSPFYNNEKDSERLKIYKKIETLNSISDSAKKSVKIIFVDDGSPNPIVDIIKEKKIDFNLKVYRIIENVRWNTVGALNLGFKMAETDWVLCIDADCYIEPDQMEVFLDTTPEEKYSYGVSALQINKDSEIFYLQLHGSFLLTKKVFDLVGGFDPDFVGQFSEGYAHFDNHLQWKLDQYGYSYYILGGPVFKDSNYDPTAGKPSYRRKHVKINKRVFRAKQFGKVPENRDLFGYFTWEKAFKFKRET